MEDVVGRIIVFGVILPGLAYLVWRAVFRFRYRDEIAAARRRGRHGR